MQLWGNGDAGRGGKSAAQRLVIVSPEPEEAAKYLADRGWRVETATSGDEGLEKAWQAGLVVVDLRVRACDGYQLLRELRWNPTTSTVPVVATGARPDDASGILAEALGCLYLPALDDLGALGEKVAEAWQGGAPQEGGDLARRRLIGIVREFMLTSGLDELSGVHNPRYLRRILETELERAKRYGRPVSIVLLDLDGFGRFNEAHGRVAGNRMLRAVGELLRRTVRRADTVGRWGGDTFGLLLPETDVDQALEVGRRVQEQLALLGEEMGLGPLSAHLGFAGYPDDGATADALMGSASAGLRAQRADKAKASEG